MQYLQIGITCLAILSVDLVWDGLPLVTDSKFAVMSQVLAEVQPGPVLEYGTLKDDRARSIGEANKLYLLGNQNYVSGNIAKSLEFYQKSLTIYRAFKDKDNEALLLNNIGVAYKSLGQYEQALEAYQQALTLRKQQKDSVGEAINLNNIGEIYHHQGKYSSALKTYQQAIEIFQSVGDLERETATLHNLGVIQYELGEYSKSLETYQLALNLRREIKDLKGVGATLNNMALVYQKLNKADRELDSYKQALAIRQTIKDRYGEAITLNNIGLFQSQHKNDLQALEYLTQSLNIFRELGDLANEGNTLDSIGTVYKSLKKFPASLASYYQALALLKKAGDRTLERATLTNIADLLKQQGQTTIAIIFYKQSINLTEQIRQDIRVLSLETQKSYTASISDIYRQLADLLIQQGRILEAQQVLDLLKVQELEDYLSDVRSGGQTLKEADYQQPEQDIIKLGIELSDLQKLNGENKLNPQQKQRLAQLAQNEEDSNKQFNAFIDSPAVQILVQQLSTNTKQQNFNLEDLNSLRTTLGNLNAVMLYPLILEDRLELILTTPYAPPIRRTVKVTKAELSKAISNLRSEIARNPINREEIEDAKKASKQIYDWLIKPFESELQQANPKTIIYSPDGVLRYIPLAALYDGKQWLIEKYSINNITASSIDKFNPKPQIALRILAGAFGGKSLEGFSGIPATAVEVETISTFIPNTLKLIGDQFTLATTKANMGSYSVIHLATHAQFRTGKPDKSFVIFGNGDKATLPSIKNWSLGNVDLVVLSACETGIGGQIGAGEEILGLGYQFQRAGARATIASLWKVSDTATQILMNNFYTNLKQGNLIKAESLRQAQISLIKGESLLGRQKIDHPFFWSPFILIGNGL